MGLTYCAVEGCKNKKYSIKEKSDNSFSFFSLPRDKDRRNKWLKKIGRPDLINDNTKPKCYFVCSKHFDESVIMYIPHLAPDAMPTKYCPQEPTGSTSSIADDSSVVNFKSTKRINKKNNAQGQKKQKRKEVSPRITDTTQDELVRNKRKKMESESQVKLETMSEEENSEDQIEWKMRKLREELYTVKEEIISEDELEQRKTMIEIELVECKEEPLEELGQDM